MRQNQAAAVGASRMTAANWRDWARNLSISTAAGVFLALAGAMDTHDLPMAARLAFWVPMMLGGALVGHALSRLVAFIPRATMSRWLFGAVLAVVIAAPITILVEAYGALFRAAGMQLPSFVQLFPSVLVISAAMTAIMVAVNWPGRETHGPEAGASPAPIRFLDRLPAKLRGAELYAVSAEDHYLRLHTSRGSDLILMRLSDAIAELEGVEGMQTHRSWWVARDAVEGARREGDRAVLLLKGGVEALVSRPNVRALRNAGWF
ncbi:MAG: LytTR family DNA-binding domain-containing protein [Hyphomonadaceae bacterium]